MNRYYLKKLIYEEMKEILLDDAIFNDREDTGVLDSFDIPGDITPDSSDGRNLSYGDIKSTDHEGRMTKKHLYNISRKSQSLHDMLHDNDDLPEWAQSKISQAAEKIETVYDYLEHKIKTKSY